MNVAEIVISLLLKAGGFKTEVADAQRSLDKTGEAGEQAMDKVSKAAQKTGTDMANAAGRAGTAWEALKPRLMAVAGLLGVGLGFKATVDAYLQQADALGKYSDSLGVAVEDVQAWEEAVKHAGGSAEGFRQSLVSLNERLVDAAKSADGEMGQLFAKMGVSIKDGAGKARSATDVMLDLASAAEKMDKGVFVGMARKLGLDQGQIMLLQQGRKAVEESVKAGKEHIRFTRADTEAAAKANDALQDMQTSLTALTMRAVAPAIPLITRLAEMIHRAAQWISENSETVTAFFMAVSVILLRQGIPAMLRFAAATWAALAPFLPIIAAVAALGVALDDLWAFITGGDSVLERMLKRFGVTQERLDSLRAVLRNVIGVFLDLWDVMTGDEKSAEAALNRLKAGWEAVQAWFKGMKDRLVQWFGDLFNRLKAWLANLLPDWLRGMLAGDEAKNAEGRRSHAAMLAGDADAAAAYDAGSAAWGMPLAGMARPGDLGRAGAGSVDNSRRVEQTTTIGTINVQTQATDAQGIARDMAGAIRNQTAQLDGAYGT